MINWNDTNFLWTQPRPLLSSAVSLVGEGMAMVHAFESGQAKTQPSTGSNSDSFLGIALGPRRTFSQSTRIENITVPAQAPYTVLLTHLVGAAPGAYQTGGALVASGNGAASPTNVQYGTDPTTGFTLLTFDPSFAGQSFSIAYSYALSVTEEQALFGNPNPGFSAEQVLNQVELFKLGRISVTNWSPSANWYAGGGLPKVKVIAGGLFTDAANAATGVVLPNVNVETLPTAASPFLTLEMQ